MEYDGPAARVRAPRAWIGVDVGTSSLKVLTVGEEGVLLEEHEQPLPVDRPGPDRAEADPLVWVRAVGEVLGPLRTSYDVIGLSVTGQMHGTVLLDEDDQPVRPAVLWPDARSRSLRAAWDDLPPRVLGRLGNPWSPGMTGPVLRWLTEHEPDVVERAVRVALPKDYVRTHLVPELPVTDPTDASGTLLWDIVDRDWVAGADDLVPRRLLPRVAESVTFAGVWRDVGVYVGAGDTPASLAALEAVAGSWEPGDIVVNLGTGAQVIDPVAEPAPGRGWPIAHTYEDGAGGHYSMVAAQNAGLGLTWAQERLAVGWEQLVALARQAPAGAGGVVFSPFVAAERGALETSTPPGWSPERPAPDLAARAALEAQAFLVRRSWELLSGEGHRVFLVGGGARDPWVRQLVADVLCTPVDHVAMRSASAVGAVILGTGPLLQSAARRPVTHEPSPDSSLHEVLDEAYARWLAHCYPERGSASR